MREIFTYGSVRGVARKGHSYRDESAGINRHGVADERAVQERVSVPS